MSVRVEVRLHNKREGRTEGLTMQSPKPSTTPKQSEEEKKKAERLAKALAWKEKMEQKKKESGKATSSDPVISPKTTSTIPPTATNSPIPPTTTASSLPPATTNGHSSPVPYAGKFDPKAVIAKKPTSSAGAKLGGDVAVPTSVSTQKPVSTPANKGKVAPSTKLPLKANRFGLGTKPTADVDKAKKASGLDFEEDEGQTRTLEKLLPMDQTEDAVLANVDQDDDDDLAEVVEEGHDEEDDEEALAARAAAVAEKRDQRLQETITGDTTADADGDVAMADSTKESDPEPEEEEVDPLDAFMSGLADEKPSKPRAAKVPSKAAKSSSGPELFLSDDDEVMPSTLENNPEDIMKIQSKKAKKGLVPVDHSKMNYPTLRKSFFTVPSELQELSPDDVEELRFQLGIKVRGKNVPPPVSSFAQCGLGLKVLDVLRNNLRFDAPTPIQQQAIPVISSGRDVLFCSKTGSGKTIAYLLPALRIIVDQPPHSGPVASPVALFMAPTRELATQIHGEIKPFAKSFQPPLKSVVAVGGQPISDDIAALKVSASSGGLSILVATPGRLVDLLSNPRVVNLSRVCYCVLDEADRMLVMGTSHFHCCSLEHTLTFMPPSTGFTLQVQAIANQIRPDRVMSLVSATFSENLQKVAKTLLKERPVEVIVGTRSTIAPEITQLVEVVPDAQAKFRRVLELLGQLFEDDESSQALIFANSQTECDELLRDLLRRGYPTLSLHGGQEMSDRIDTLNDFRAGRCPLLVATSVAARGLDIGPTLRLVINYSPPNHSEDYIHRLGRTGRAGAKGTGATFLLAKEKTHERYAYDIAKVMESSKIEVPPDVQKMANTFLQDVKDGNEKMYNSGFGGRGLDHIKEQREAERNRERRVHKMGDEPDEEEEKAEKKVDDEILVKAKITQPTAAAAAPSATAPAGDSTLNYNPEIVVKKYEAPPQQPGGKKDALSLVAEAKARIDARLNRPGSLRTGQAVDNRGPDAGEYHATLEINDFPQRARWAVTNRTNVAKILDATGTSITTKGNYYLPGKEPGANDPPKLYILVEGDTEVVVTTAMRELLTLLRSGTESAVEAQSRAPTGRYSVV